MDYQKITDAKAALDSDMLVVAWAISDLARAVRFAAAGDSFDPGGIELIGMAIKELTAQFASTAEALRAAK